VAKPESLMLSIPEAAAMLGVSVTSFRLANDAGHIGPMPVRIGRRVLFIAEEYREWIRQGCKPRVVHVGGRRQ
jgi:predicted DNA-binding transcriptional regulator AlpA